ncbi:ATP-binding protein [Bacillus cereus]|uniref:Uncharacterized protein n=1 Tax=Bacillus cereus TaxID=1396 RepID=A0A161R7A7_BACCE|nr:ATP-binding protein [Bacillus cereus]KZD72141.1 hypothetical protein B4088_0602 [Bacillus cereus]
MNEIKDFQQTHQDSASNPTNADEPLKQETSSKETISNMMNAIKNKNIHFELTEDEKEDGYFNVTNNKCRFGNCDGTGFIYTKVNKRWKTSECKCRQELILNRKLYNAQIEPEFFDSSLTKLSDIDDYLTLYRLQPREHPVPLEDVIQQLKLNIKTRKKPANVGSWKELPEEYHADTYIDMYYSRVQQRKASEFFTGYINSIFKRIENNQKTINLLLFGEPGAAKSYTSSAIAKTFLKKGKTAFYVRMKKLIDNPKILEESIQTIKDSEICIFDELGGEYHKETKWALKQIQDIIKMRQEQNLPTIVITNLYPHELHTLYKQKVMSIFNGKFLPIHMVNSVDLRIHFQLNDIAGEDFLL